MKKVKNIYKQFSALVWKEDDWYVAKCVEVAVASQGKTKPEALTNLKEALELYFQDEVPIKDLPITKEISLEEIRISHA